jgi:hypothetical protein
MALCHLKWYGFRLSSLSWKLYLQMDVLFWEILWRNFFLRDLYELAFTWQS